MYKLLPILLFAVVASQDDIDTYLKYHPTAVNSQNSYKEAYYQLMCNGDTLSLEYNIDIERVLLPEFIRLNFNSILNPNNYFIEIDSVMKIGFLFDMEHKEKEFYTFREICADKTILDDMYIWRSIGFIKYVQATIYIDYSINIDLIESAVDGLMSELFPFADCINCLKYQSVDINNFLDKNIQNKKVISNLLNRADIYDDSWAVIIGIDKYQYSDQLNYAVKDAEAVKDMLIDKFNYHEENIRYLTDEKATLSEIKLALDDISSSADEDDRILVFYSGHGETQPNNDGTETGYIIPVEGRQEKPYATGLAMDDILRTCQMSNAKHMLFLMDACYSGLMTEKAKGLALPQEEGYLSKVANEKARQIITAGGSGEQVIERDEWQHSVFTKNLLEGLDDWEADNDEDGYVTADELGTYLRISVTEDSDFHQTPQKGRFRNSGGGEFVFFSDATITIPISHIDEEDEIIYGCMDEGAVNYNPDAIKPDRSCQYGELVTSLEFGEIKRSKQVLGTSIINRIEAIIPGGKTGKKDADGYIEVPIIINNNSEIAGFQCDVIGGKIIDVSGGVVEEYGFMSSHSGSTILSFSLTGEVFSRGGNQVLINIKIVPEDSHICIEDVILSDIDGNSLKSTSFFDCFKP